MIDHCLNVGYLQPMVGNRNVIPIFCRTDEVHSLGDISARKCFEGDEGAPYDKIIAHRLYIWMFD